MSNGIYSGQPIGCSVEPRGSGAGVVGRVEALRGPTLGYKTPGFQQSAHWSEVHYLGISSLINSQVTACILTGDSLLREKTLDKGLEGITYRVNRLVWELVRYSFTAPAILFCIGMPAQTMFVEEHFISISTSNPQTIQIASAIIPNWDYGLWNHIGV